MWASTADVSGEPLVQVEVALEADGAPDRTFTDALGRFAFSDVAPGTYQIIVEPPGYERVRLTMLFQGVAGIRIVTVVQSLLPVRRRGEE